MVGLIAALGVLIGFANVASVLPGWVQAFNTLLSRGGCVAFLSQQPVRWPIVAWCNASEKFGDLYLYGSSLRPIGMIL